MIKGFLRLYEKGDQLNARLAGVLPVGNIYLAEGIKRALKRYRNLFEQVNDKNMCIVNTLT